MGFHILTSDKNTCPSGHAQGGYLLVDPGTVIHAGFKTAIPQIYFFSANQLIFQYQPDGYGNDNKAYYVVSNGSEQDIDWYGVLVVSAPDGTTPTIYRNSIGTIG
jgi:hypothetical protein